MSEGEAKTLLPIELLGGALDGLRCDPPPLVPLGMPAMISFPDPHTGGPVAYRLTDKVTRGGRAVYKFVPGAYPAGEKV